MSITGPGCAHCDGGRVTDEFGNVRPCDRCGGFSQLTATVLDDGGPCPNCDGVGTLAATTYSVNGPARYPCGACGGMGRRLVPSPSGPQRFAVVPCAAVVIAPEDDWRPLPSVAEVLAHNARTGGDCFGPWMWLRAGTTETEGLVRAVMICAALTDDSPNGERVVKVATNEDVMHDDRFRPITRRGEALPWPEVSR